MCGRYSLATYTQMHGWKPRYNVAPTSTMPIVTSEGIKLARWGLIPKWSPKFESPKFSTINARSETIFESKLYSNPIKTQKALAPANSFFEWKADGKVKQPYLIKLKSRPLFYFAAIYETWHDEEISYSLLTTEPNSFMEKIHNRQPLILDEDDEKKWIDPDLVEEDQIKKLLKPTPPKDFEAYAVSTLVNRPGNDSPAVLEKLEKGS